MTVISCAYDYDHDYRMTTDDRGRNTYSVKWIIQTDDPTQSVRTIATQAQSTTSGFTNPLPGFWSAYSFNGVTDPYAFFKGGLQLYRKEPNNSRTVWSCEGVFEPLAEGQTALHANENPLLRPAMYRLESEAYNETVWEDRFGNPITDSALRSYDEQPVEDYVADVLVIVKNIGTLDAVIALNNTYRYSVNSSAYRGAPARHAKIDNITSSSVITEGNYSYYQAYIRIVFKYRPWDMLILDEGYYHKDPLYPDDLVRATNTVLVKEYDDQGNAIGEKLVSEKAVKPVLLDGQGRRLPPAGKPVFRTFELRKEVDYSPLNAL